MVRLFYSREYSSQHETRTDYAQLMTSIFLLLAGPGPLSVDSMSSQRFTSEK